MSDPLAPGPFDLRGRVALVTGGSRGLGEAMARALAQAGADVVIASRSEGELRALSESLAVAGGARAGYVVGDLSRRADAERTADAAASMFGRLDILVSNAGSNVPQRIEDVEDESWDEILELHVGAAMALTRAVAPGMKERGWGRIVYVSSILGHIGMESRSAYTTAKAALLGLARSSAADLGPSGITVNCLAPGAFTTEMGTGSRSASEQSTLTERTALGRWGSPPELAGPLLLLASDAGSYITGTTLVVDGGWLAT